MYHFLPRKNLSLDRGPNFQINTRVYIFRQVVAMCNDQIISKYESRKSFMHRGFQKKIHVFHRMCFMKPLFPFVCKDISFRGSIFLGFSKYAFPAKTNHWRSAPLGVCFSSFVIQALVMEHSFPLIFCRFVCGIQNEQHKLITTMNCSLVKTLIYIIYR